MDHSVYQTPEQRVAGEALRIARSTAEWSGWSKPDPDDAPVNSIGRLDEMEETIESLRREVSVLRGEVKRLRDLAASAR